MSPFQKWGLQAEGWDFAESCRGLGIWGWKESGREGVGWCGVRDYEIMVGQQERNSAG